MSVSAKISCIFCGRILVRIRLLHLRQWGAFGIISRLLGNVFNSHAVNIFTIATLSSKSWFLNIHDICLRYNLQHPLELLKAPLEEKYNNLIKQRVVDYWKQELRSEDSICDSLT